jgi:hypothetical protein
VTCVVLAFSVYWCWYRPPRLGDLVAEADHFRPPDSWLLVDETTRNRSPACIDTTCPSVFRRWEMSDPPSVAALQDLLDAAGWGDFGVDGDCQPIPGRSGSVNVCSSRGTSDGLDITLRVSGPHADARPFWLSLSVEG